MNWRTCCAQSAPARDAIRGTTQCFDRPGQSFEAIEAAVASGDLHGARVAALEVFRSRGATHEVSKACGTVWRASVDALLLNDTYLNAVRTAHSDADLRGKKWLISAGHPKVGMKLTQEKRVSLK